MLCVEELHFDQLTCQTNNFSFGKHGLDVSTTILRKDKTTASTLSVSFPTRERNKVGIDRCRIGIEHEFLRNFWNIGCVLLVILFVFRILLFFFFLVLVVTVFVLLLVHLWWWWRRRWWRWNHFVVVHRSVDEGSSGCNGQLHR